MLKKRSLILGFVLLGAILAAGMGLVGCNRPPMFCGGGFHGKEKPDLNILSALVKSHVERFPNRVDMFVDDFMEFYGVLNENQKAVITTHLKEKFKKFEAFKAFLSS